MAGLGSQRARSRTGRVFFRSLGVPRRGFFFDDSEPTPAWHSGHSGGGIPAVVPDRWTFDHSRQPTL